MEDDSPPVYRKVPDPQVFKVLVCTQCQGSMGELRLYEGLAKNKQHHRGRLVQTCYNKICHHTVFHGPHNYLWEDGVHLIARLNALETRTTASLPADVLSAPLRVLPKPGKPATDGPSPCPGDCRRQNGAKAHGRRECIELKCKPCCIKAQHASEVAHILRDRCKAHGVSGVTPPEPVNQLPRAEEPPAPALAPVQLAAQPSILLAGTGLHAQLLPVPPPPASVPPVSPPVPPVVSPVISPRRQVVPQPLQAPAPPTQPAQGPASQPTSRLANPISKTWTAARVNAINKTKAKQENKSVMAQMIEEEKRTIELVIWSKPNADATRIVVPVVHYPRLKLEFIELLVKGYKLTDDSLFDYFNGVSWEIITPKSILLVEKGRPVLLRHRPSLTDDIPIPECHGLQAAMVEQSRSGRKRVADDVLVSPIKKAARTSEAHAVTDDIHPANADSSSTPNSELNRDDTKDALTGTTPPIQVRSAEDISIYAWKNGWRTIIERKDNNPGATDASEYPKIFGIPYVKSTVTNYKKCLKQAPTALVDKFYAHGDTRDGSFKHFIFACRKGKSSSSSTLPDTGLAEAPQATVRLPLTTTPSSVLDVVPKPEPEVPTIPTSPPHPSDTGNTRSIAPAIEHATRQLEEIRLPSPIPDDTPEEKELDRALKKHAGLFHAILDEMEADGTASRQPSRLCPFCDQLLPVSPSQKLLSMQKHLESISTLDPMPGNPLHRRCKAGFTTYVDFCVLHEFEAKELPDAAASGWPMEPDFGTLYDRACRAYLFFATVSKSDNNLFLNAAKDFYNEDRQTKESARGQYESGRFEQTGAGYYGEAGYQIVHAAVRHLVPSTAVDLLDIWPVSYTAFLREVLVPETTVRLIEIDMNVSYNTAVSIFHKSCRFGNQTHSMDSAENEIHIRNAMRRSTKDKYHNYDTYRRWIASGSALGVDAWLAALVKPKVDTVSHAGKSLPEITDEEELRVKQEESEMDPFADMEEEDEELLGHGSAADPIVID